MLLPDESKLEKMKKVVLMEPLSVNIAHATPSVPNYTSQPNVDVTSAPNFDPMSQFNGYRANPSGCCFNRGRGGRFGGLFKVQCQISFKTGHDASIYYHRPSSKMPSSWNAPQQWHGSPPHGWDRWINSPN